MLSIFSRTVKPKTKSELASSLSPAQPLELPQPEKMGPACRFLQRMLMSGAGQAEYTEVITYSPVSVVTGSTKNFVADPSAFLANMKLLLMAMIACQEERRAEVLGYALPPSSVHFAKLEAQVVVTEESKTDETTGAKPA